MQTLILQTLTLFAVLFVIGMPMITNALGKTFDDGLAVTLMVSWFLCFSFAAIRALVLLPFLIANIWVIVGTIGALALIAGIIFLIVKWK